VIKKKIEIYFVQSFKVGIRKEAVNENLDICVAFC
jgi:hypothetical protein